MIDYKQRLKELDTTAGILHYILERDDNTEEEAKGFIEHLEQVLEEVKALKNEMVVNKVAFFKIPR